MGKFSVDVTDISTGEVEIDDSSHCRPANFTNDSACK